MNTPNPSHYLGECNSVNVCNVKVVTIARSFAINNPIDTAKQCFEFVRDKIKHSSDYQLNPITCRASDVLEHGTGYCYAKSHLLCALLRANDIPAGLCYQRLSVDGDGPPFCLHGLNAAYLPEYGWYRMDARGNRDDVDAQFDPPNEQLAFSTSLPEEFDLPDIYAKPLPIIVEALARYQTWDALLANLPDTKPLS
ncbi:MAG: transglutaminase-like domain-containing protein [Planctomycetota bacterium]